MEDTEKLISEDIRDMHIAFTKMQRINHHYLKNNKFNCTSTKSRIYPDTHGFSLKYRKQIEKFTSTAPLTMQISQNQPYEQPAQEKEAEPTDT